MTSPISCPLCGQGRVCVSPGSARRAERWLLGHHVCPRVSRRRIERWFRGEVDAWLDEHYGPRAWAERVNAVLRDAGLSPADVERMRSGVDVRVVSEGASA